MLEMHINPSAKQALAIPCVRSKSGGVQDMTKVQAGVICMVTTVGAMAQVPFGATVTEMPAVLSIQTSSSLLLIHQFSTGEFAAAGVIVVWPKVQLEDGDWLEGDPIQLRLRYPWEKLRN